MTRFARAKGSKASNERVAEEATSWSEMKQQLLEKNQEVEDARKREEAEQQRQANYNSFLEDLEKQQFESTEWAEFPDAPKPKKMEKPKGKKDKKNKKEKGEITRQEIEVAENDAVALNNKSNLVEVVAQDDDGPPEEYSSKVEPPKILVKKAKKKKQPVKIDVKIDDKVDAPKNKKRKFEGGEENNVPAKKKRVAKTQQPQESRNDNSLKRKKNAKKVQKKKDLSNLSEAELKKVEKKKQKRLKQLEKKKQAKMEKKEKEISGELVASDNQGESKSENNSENSPANKQFKKFDKPFNKRFEKPQNFKKGKPRDNEKHDRRKERQEKFIINGREIDVAYVDGFPVKKEDATRINLLKKQMITKGLPRSEIKIALKLERRKAEKAFAREKKKVCFNCRKSGHNLSECPDLGKNDLVQSAGTGICFKCGSTEHTHFECKVVKGQEYRFAKCFICKEQGHISRQCPDNNRGLYPKGGACRVCGDVTHLKKDCPQYQAQQHQAGSKISVEVMNGGNPESMGGDEESPSKVPHKKPNKIVKF